MNYDEFFADAIGRPSHERRYRVFADLERIAGRYLAMSDAIDTAQSNPAIRCLNLTSLGCL
jgi:hypothetical protein